jgi:hypothetical protein
MIPANPFKLACAAAFATGLLAASAAVAQPSGVAPLNVTAEHPTTVTVSIHGKDAHAVRRDVGAAAHFVCRNFVGVKGISLDDVDWCADQSFAKAMKQYAAIVSSHTLADSGAIVLSAR